MEASCTQSNCATLGASEGIVSGKYFAGSYGARQRDGQQEFVIKWGHSCTSRRLHCTLQRPTLVWKQKWP